MDLFLCFGIIKKFYENCFVNTCKHTSMPNLRPQAYKTAYFIKENLIKYLMNQISKNLSVGEQDMTF